MQRVRWNNAEKVVYTYIIPGRQTEFLLLLLRHGRVILSFDVAASNIARPRLVPFARAAHPTDSFHRVPAPSAFVDATQNLVCFKMHGATGRVLDV